MAMTMEPAFDRVFDTQRVFRLLLDGMARPGKMQRLPSPALTPPPGLAPYAAGVAFALLDGETTFAVAPARHDWQHYLTLNTGAHAVGAAAAAFVLVRGEQAAPVLAEMNRGDLLMPEQGATMVCMVEKIAADVPGDVRLSLRGPGVAGTAALSVTGWPPAAVEALAEANSEFPLGVDVILIDAGGVLACIPRSITFTWEATR